MDIIMEVEPASQIVFHTIFDRFLKNLGVAQFKVTAEGRCYASSGDQSLVGWLVGSYLSSHSQRT